MELRKICTWGVATTSLISNSAFGVYTQGQNSPPPVMPEITVEADAIPMKQRLFEFVERVTRQMDSTESLARWKQPVCPLVAGLPERVAEWVLTRVSTIARDIGAPLADGKCDPNLYIIFSSQPEEFLKTWRRKEGLLFGNAFPATVARFLQGKRPVKVWYNDTLVGAVDESPSIINVTGGQQYQYQAHRARGNRAMWDTVLQITSAIVVVDLNQAKGIEIHPLADYIGMVALMEINLDANVGHAPSVLRLFNDPVDSRSSPDALAGLSTWDWSFLRGLYQTSQASRSQKGEIRASMERDSSLN